MNNIYMADNKKPQMNVAVLGHVDTGKSTLVGRLIYECGSFNECLFQKIEEEARGVGKLSYKYAFIMEKYSKENCWKFDTPNYTLNILDGSTCEGRLNKNLLNGVFKTDVVTLVVSSAKGEYEAGGYSDNGQTREHAFLASLLGVTQIIVAITKLDLNNTNYAQERYEEIKREVSNFLSRIGYKPEEVPFVPVSGWTGDNLTTKSDKLPWYDGPTLLECLDAMKTGLELLNSRPLRIPIQDVYNISGVGTVLVGRVESGRLKVNDQILVAPGNLPGEVTSIQLSHQSVDEAGPGDVISFSVPDLSVKDLRRGFVVGHLKNEPPVEAIDFVAQIIILNHPGEICEGYTPVLDLHNCHVPCRFTELLAKLDKRTGKELETAPNVKPLRKGGSALVRIEPTRPIVVEAAMDFAPLGRFVVREMEQIVAVGMIKSVNKKRNSEEYKK